jgi:hypothetical protein
VTLRPRHVPVEEARRELGAWLIDWQERRGLTDAEFLLLVSEAATDRLRSHVRSERTEGES